MSKFSDQVAQGMSEILQNKSFYTPFKATVKVASGETFDFTGMEQKFPDAYNSLKQHDKVQFSDFIFFVNEAGKLEAKDPNGTDEYIFIHDNGHAPVWMKVAQSDESAFEIYAKKKKEDDDEDDKDDKKDKKSKKDDKDEKDEKSDKKKSKKDDKDDEEEDEKDDKKSKKKKSKKDEDENDAVALIFAGKKNKLNKYAYYAANKDDEITLQQMSETYPNAYETLPNSLKNVSGVNFYANSEGLPESDCIVIAEFGDGQQYGIRMFDKSWHKLPDVKRNNPANGVGISSHAGKKDKEEKKDGKEKPEKDDDKADKKDKPKGKKKQFPFWLKKKKAGENCKAECDCDECMEANDGLFAAAIRHIVDSFSKTSAALDNMGLEKSSIATMAILDHIINEAASIKYAKEGTPEAELKRLKDQFKKMHEKDAVYDAEVAEELDRKITELEKKVDKLKDKNDVRGTDLLLGLDDPEAQEGFLDHNLDDPHSSAALEEILKKNPSLVDEIAPRLKSQFGDQAIEDQLKERIKSRLPSIIETPKENSDYSEIMKAYTKDYPDDAKIPSELKDTLVPGSDSHKTKIDELNADDHKKLPSHEHGKPVIYLTDKDKVLCADCATEAKEDGKKVKPHLNEEGPDHHCEECGEKLESEYGDSDKHDANDIVHAFNLVNNWVKEAGNFEDWTKENATGIPMDKLKADYPQAYAALPKSFKTNTSRFRVFAPSNSSLDPRYPDISLYIEDDSFGVNPDTKSYGYSNTSNSWIPMGYSQPANSSPNPNAKQSSKLNKLMKKADDSTFEDEGSDDKVTHEDLKSVLDVLGGYSQDEIADREKALKPSELDSFATEFLNMVK